MPVTAEIVGINGLPVGLTLEYSLSQNIPNPFNPNINIAFAIRGKSHVDLSIYDITGARVANLMNSDLEAGTYRVTFSGRDENGRILLSGVYFYNLETDNNTVTRKMIFMK